ncbi:MAG: hypothetical protein K5981_09895, partial [Clostridia bacterium]|nr:hypothetical protein [Clostridia bacterium]
MHEQKTIQALLSEMESEYERGNIELKQLPRGVLRITRNGPKRISFFREYQYEGVRKRKGIGLDEALIYQLAHKAYLQEKQRRLAANAEKLKNMRDGLESLESCDILQAMPRHFDLLDARRVISGEQLKTQDFPHPVFDGSILPERAGLDTGGLSLKDWAEKPYCANTKRMEHLVHRTSRGILCRSKSEVAILELYDRLGLVYHYDEVVEIDGYYRAPDFRFVRPDRKLIYHEHAGLLDEAYRDDLMDKLMIYRLAGIEQGKNLILTF